MKYLPDDVYETIFDIDFDKLYANGKRIILSDLDNTLATYGEHSPSKKLIAWSKKVQSIGFKLFLISNNTKARIDKFIDALNVTKALSKAHKPFAFKLKRFLKQELINTDEVVVIGDQIVTDVVLSKKCGLYVILVKSLDRSTEKWYTRLNRSREKKMMRKIKNEHLDLYQKMLNIGIKHE